MREADFDRVRQLRLDRLRQLKDLPPAVAERAFLQLLYPSHPYGHLAIGTRCRAARVHTSTRSFDFTRRRFVPWRATLVVAGALSHADLVGDRGTGVRRVDAARDRARQVPSDRGADVVRGYRSRGSRSSLAKAPRNPSCASAICRRAATRRTTRALLVMNAILGGQFVSRINLKLREEKAFTYGARTGFDWRRGVGPFSVQTSVHTAATAESIARHAEGNLRICVARVRPTAQELSLAQASLTRGYPRTSRPRSRSRARSRSSRCSICRIPTSRSSFRRSTR